MTDLKAQYERRLAHAEENRRPDLAAAFKARRAALEPKPAPKPKPKKKEKAE